MFHDFSNFQTVFSGLLSRKPNYRSLGHIGSTLTSLIADISSVIKKYVSSYNGLSQGYVQDGTYIDITPSAQSDAIEAQLVLAKESLQTMATNYGNLYRGFLPDIALQSTDLVRVQDNDQPWRISTGARVSITGTVDIITGIPDPYAGLPNVGVSNLAFTAYDLYDYMGLDYYLDFSENGGSLNPRQELNGNDIISRRWYPSFGGNYNGKSYMLFDDDTGDFHLLYAPLPGWPNSFVMFHDNSDLSHYSAYLLGCQTMGDVAGVGSSQAPGTGYIYHGNIDILCPDYSKYRTAMDAHGLLAQVLPTPDEISGLIDSI